MSTSDGKSTTRPLGRRRSKRFDRRGGSPVMTGSATIDTAEDDVDVDVEVDVPEPADELPDLEAAASTEIETDHDAASRVASSIAEDLPDGAEDAETAAESEADTATESVGESVGESAPESATEASSPTGHPPIGGALSRRPDATGRSRSLDQKSPCGRCGHDVSIVHIEVDGNVLMMESCDNCDTRRWQLAGEPIELQQALDHVGEHTGRRR